jgi:hypothetical protein
MMTAYPNICATGIPKTPVNLYDAGIWESVQGDWYESSANGGWIWDKAKTVDV